MRLQVRKGSCLDYEGQAIILFHFSDTRPLKGYPALLDWRCNASISTLWKRRLDLFKFGQLTIVATQGKLHAQTVILAGLGASDSLDGDLRKEACRLALAAALKVGAKEIAIDASSLAGGGEHVSADEIRSVLSDIDEKGTLRIALFTEAERKPSPSVRMKGSADGVA